MKKVCIIYANCQNRLIASYLLQSPEFSQRYIIKKFRAHVLIREGKTIPDRVLQKTDLFIYQPVKSIHGISSSEHISNRLPKNCQRISLPSIYFSGYFPQYCRNPIAQSANKNYPLGIIPHGDANIIKMLNSGHSTEEIIAKLSDPDFYSHSFLQKHLQQTLAELARRESKLSIKISEFIRANYQHHYLFNTQNHPSDIVGIHVVNQILNILDIPDLGNEFDFAKPVPEVLNHIQIPIYPSVVKHFELAFADRLNSYRHGGFCTAEMTFEKYIREYIKLHNSQPESSITYCLKGIELANQGDLDLAKVEIINAIKAQPANANYYRDLGEILCKQNHLDRAVSAYKKAIEISPQWSPLYAALGDIFAAKKDYYSAILVYKQALILAPNDAALLCTLGNLLMNHSQFDLATTYYRKAIANDPSKAYYHRCLGDSYEKRKDFEQAASNYQKAIELSPDAAYLHNRLGNILAKQNRLEEAVDACKQAVELNRKNPNFYRVLGNIQLKRGDVDEAFKTYQQAIELKPAQMNLIFPKIGSYIKDKVKKTDAVPARSH